MVCHQPYNAEKAFKMTALSVKRQCWGIIQLKAERAFKLMNALSA